MLSSTLLDGLILGSVAQDRVELLRAESRLIFRSVEQSVRESIQPREKELGTSGAQSLVSLTACAAAASIAASLSLPSIAATAARAAKYSFAPITTRCSATTRALDPSADVRVHTSTLEQISQTKV